MRYADWTDADWKRLIKRVRARGIYALKGDYPLDAG